MYNLIPYMTLSILFICIAWLLLKTSHFYKTQSNIHSQTKFETIDGLRGFLALGVFFHHAAISQQYFRTGSWAITEEYPLYHFAAKGGVSLFFMITGFLFWTKVISTKGQINTSHFFKSRINRLVPLYFFHVFIIIILAFKVQEFQLLEQPIILIKNILSWLAFGILKQPNINQVLNTYTMDAGVIWTLAYEWAFYVSLPLLACFWRGRSFFLMIVIIVSYGFLVPDVTNIKLFAYGMVAAYLVQNFSLQAIVMTRGCSVIACILLILAYQVTYLKVELFFLFFILIVYGNPLFGILTSKPAKLLGIISYSIYLMQGAVIYIVFHTINRYSLISELQPPAFLLATALCGTLLIVISAMTYRFVEAPFLLRRS